MSGTIQLKLQDLWNQVEKGESKRAIELAMKAVHSVREDEFKEALSDYVAWAHGDEWLRDFNKRFPLVDLHEDE